MSERKPPTHLLYRQALRWLYAFSDTERTGAFVRDRDDNLRRERALLAALDDPQLAYGVIHIAGSKGKGSTSAMIASILAAAGVRAGLYTSPDLHTFRERIRVAGEPIREEEMVGMAAKVRVALERVDPSVGPYITWEVATALAFLAFREADVERAVIEVGLGGRLDATNVVDPDICAITSISYEHMEILGHTLTEIAREKAGIIKIGVPVVTSAREPEALAVIARIADERDAPLIRVGPVGAEDCAYTWREGVAGESFQRFDIITPTSVYHELEIPLLGAHQIENAAVAVALAEFTRAQGLTALGERAIREGLRTVRWEGRLQVVGRAPWQVVDGAHNAASFAALFAALRRHFRYRRIILILGVMADKDVEGILREINAAGVSTIIATAANSLRAISPKDLRERAAHVTNAEVTSACDAASALTAARATADPGDLILVAGTLYLAAEALRWYAAQPETPAGAIQIAGMDH
ncbi:MAG TPA: folylpolyglutamate synthase/dihydrofolate synthase family protein [Ktedonobacterales bacterium]|nr:folylpolyglutamate synthase/dihydrofolate synthase family protein [Ktedonobacterales bacterium]